MANGVTIFAAEHTPLYLPLYVARELGPVKTGVFENAGKIAIRYPDEGVGDGDEGAVSALLREFDRYDACRDRFFAVCDPLKILKDERCGTLAVLASIICKAAFWEIGTRQHLHTRSEGTKRVVFTYPPGMSAHVIARNLFTDDEISAVTVNHELCNLLVATTSQRPSAALTANLVAAMRFNKLHKREGFDIIQKVASRGRYEDYFLTGLLGHKASAKGKIAEGLIHQIRDAVRWIKQEPDRAAAILAKEFLVGTAEARQVVDEFLDAGFYDKIVPEKSAWTNAFEVFKSQESSNGSTGMSVEDQADHTFKACVVAEVATKVASRRLGSLRLVLRRLYIKSRIRVEEINAGIDSRGIFAKMIRWVLIEGVLVTLIGLLVGAGISEVLLRVRSEEPRTQVRDNPKEAPQPRGAAPQATHR